MKGIHYMVEDHGEKQAVLIDLQETSNCGRTSMIQRCPAEPATNRVNRWKVAKVN